MKKPNPHFMDRKVVYKKGRRDDAKKQQQNNDNKQEEKPKQKLSRKQRIQEKRKQKIIKLRQKKGEVVNQLSAAQHSTKSMGKFDRKAHGQQRKLKVKRRKEHANFKTIDEQIERNFQVLGLVKRMQGSKKVGHSL